MGLRRRPIMATIVLVSAVAAAWWWLREEEPPVDLSSSVVQYLSSTGDDQAYARVTEPRQLVFPDDAGAHPEYRTEWWYYTGNLVDADGRPFGFQLTFFRNAIAPGVGLGAEPPDRIVGSDAADDDGLVPSDATDDDGVVQPDRTDSDWRTNQVYLAHFAVTDADGDAYHSAERLSRGAAGLAGSHADPFDVWVEGWRAEAARRSSEIAATRADRDGGLQGTEATPTDRDGGFRGVEAIPTVREGGFRDVAVVRLTADDEGYAIDLSLTPAKPVVFHGDRGFSPKGPEPGNASYYYSYPRLSTTGTVVTPTGAFEVTGDSWMDHEWSTSVLDAETQTGWDWFSVQLDDGRELMVFQIRERGGGTAPASSGSLIDEAGTVTHLKMADFAIAVLDTWRSPKTGAVYPSRWQVRVPEHGLDLEVVPLRDDQELETSIRYWEGAVTATGSADGKPVGGRGYVELTGYAGDQALPGSKW